jgi:hypothetical protein
MSFDNDMRIYCEENKNDAKGDDIISYIIFCVIDSFYKKKSLFYWVTMNH